MITTIVGAALGANLLLLVRDIRAGQPLRAHFAETDAAQALEPSIP